MLGGCIGPFSLAGRLYDMSEIMILIYQNPEAAHTLLAKCTEYILRYCKALKETGVNGVVMAEPAAGLMSDEDCKRFSSDYVKQIVDQVQDDYFTIILHNCGNTGHCTKAMAATGAGAYHFGNKCDMAEVIREIPPTALAMGNLDPVSVFKESTPEAMHKATAELLGRMRDYPNFVLSSGCDTPPTRRSPTSTHFSRNLKNITERTHNHPIIPKAAYDQTRAKFRRPCHRTA